MVDILATDMPSSVGITDWMDFAFFSKVDNYFASQLFNYRLVFLVTVVEDIQNSH